MKQPDSPALAEVSESSDALLPSSTPALTLACAVACGIIVANLYFAQPLLDLIGPDLKIGDAVGGFIVTLTQFGYGIGLLLVVPLADRLENRRLILTMLACTVLALAAVTLAPNEGLFLASTLALGIAAAGAQIILPFAASLAPEHERGKMIGNIMAGLLTGIMLARPAASLIASEFGWRAVFGSSAVLVLLLTVCMARILPERRPHSRESYGAILASMGRLMATMRPLQRRALYQSVVFIVFNIFWTAAPLMLARDFGLTQKGIALFALAGAGGALAAPLAGRLGDAGYVRAGTGAALATAFIAFLVSGYAVEAHLLLGLVLLAVLIDASAQVNQVLSQRVIFGIAGQARARVNAVFMTTMFLLGGTGPAIATLTYHAGGWSLAALTAAGLLLFVFAVFLTERRWT